MTESYICRACGTEFDKGWSEAAAVAEFQRQFGRPPNMHEDVMVCDDCHKLMTKWMETRGMTIHQLLAWLDKEDRPSLYGECKGAVLDDIVRRQFAIVTKPPAGSDMDYARVRLTDLGRAELIAARRLDPTL